MRRFVAVATCLLGVACSDNTGTRPFSYPDTKLVVFSDPHYFDPSLGTSGAAFEDYLAHDRKLIAESDAIMRAMLANVATEKPNVVLISGDLTKDGEASSHGLVATFLAQMKAMGNRVFVVPGNHDIQNGAANSYSADETAPVPAVSATEFAQIYAPFGYADALSRDLTSLSYVAELEPGLRLLALDSCIYGDSRGSSLTSGAISDATRTWIKEQLDQAARAGARVIAMMHHGLVEHFASQNLIFPEYLVSDRDAIGALLSNDGVGLVFTGHFHANDVTQGTPVGASRSMFDVETGSTVTYPCAYRVIQISDDKAAITTRHITSIDYDLGSAPDFQSYARASLHAGLSTLISGLIEAAPYSMSPTDATQIAPWLGDGLVAHYVGDEVVTADAQAQIQTLLASGDSVKTLAGVMLQNIWTDKPPPDNTLTIDLAAR